MKVYFVYDGEGDASGNIVSKRLEREAYKVKITLPAKWVAGPCLKLLTYFCDTYNKKFPDAPLAADEMALKIGAVELALDQAVEGNVAEYNDVLIVHKASVALEAVPEGSLKCSNFGCGKHFLPADNGDAACAHHAKGPIFHDTAKFWSCCPDRKAQDWADFEAIPPCVTGPHSTENNGAAFVTASAEVDNVPMTGEQLAAMQATQAVEQRAAADAPQRNGAREFEEAVHQNSSQPTQDIVDGKATCRNYGCQQEFAVADNGDASCTFHKGGPVFHDTYKYWKCCADKKQIEFDDFVKVPGCTTGPHKL
jgi:hypothetical protein